MQCNKERVMQQFNTSSFEKLNQPLQKIAELNKDTFQKFSYLKPEDFQINNPQILVEKSLQIFIKNSHRSIDYFHQLFNILEGSWEHLFQETFDKTRELTKRPQSFSSAVRNEISRSSPLRASSKRTSPHKTSNSNSHLSKKKNSKSISHNTGSSKNK